MSRESSLSESELRQLQENQRSAGFVNDEQRQLAQKVSQSAARIPRGMNKLENLFAETLRERQDRGELVWYQFEAIRFRLADGAYYKPDWAAVTNQGNLLLYECKGFWREAARVRIKVAADRHPFHFCAVRKLKVREGGGWSYESFRQALDRLNGKLT
jgi:hypothetical protein